MIPREQPRQDRRWPMILLRVSSFLASVLLLTQAVLAGIFMSKVRLAFDLHRENATFAGVVVMIWLAAAILTRALAGGPPRAVSASVGILLLVTLQAFAGFRHLTAVHVPLGTVVITLSVLATVRIWRWQPRQAATPGSTASRP